MVSLLKSDTILAKSELQLFSRKAHSLLMKGVGPSADYGEPWVRKSISRFVASIRFSVAPGELKGPLKKQTALFWEQIVW